jgi:nicotinamidase-related amidase
MTNSSTITNEKKNIKKTTKPKTTKPKTTKPKTTKPKTTKPKTIKPKTTKPKTIKPKTIKPKTTKFKKNIKGGAEKLKNITDLNIIWNSILYKKFYKKFKNNKNKNNYHGYLTNNKNKKNYALFIIDMQNDFLNRPYRRSGEVKCVELNKNKEINIPGMQSKCRLFGSELKFQIEPTPVDPNENHSVPSLNDVKVNGEKLGNFNVAGSENSLVADIREKLRNALEDDLCTNIFITRDYHPDGHMSFNPFLTPKPYCACQDGCFPAHCIQGHSGSLIISDINNILKNNKYNNQKNKVKILFKGMFDNCDSFTGVQKNEIDNYSSNTKMSSSNKKICSSISGSYEICYSNNKSIPMLEALNFNTPIEFEQNNTNKKIYINIKNSKHKLKHYDFKTLSNDVNEIQVCGLAGDYCVRDTIKALAEMHRAKNIVLLAGLTRYPVLPLFTMASTPIHNYIPNLNLPNIDASNYDLNLIKKQEQVINNFNNTSNSKKSLYYYTLKVDDGGNYSLYDTITNTNTNTKTKTMQNMVTTEDFKLNNEGNKFHFITPPEEILNDYNLKNIKIIFRNQDLNPDYTNYLIKLILNSIFSNIYLYTIFFIFSYIYKP